MQVVLSLISFEKLKAEFTVLGENECLVSAESSGQGFLINLDALVGKLVQKVVGVVFLKIQALNSSNKESSLKIRQEGQK